MINKHPLEKYFTLIENNYVSIIYEDFNDFDSFYGSFDPNIFNDASMTKNGDLYEIRSGNKLLNSFTFKNHLEGYLNDYKTHFIDNVRTFILDKSEKAIIDYAKLLQKEINKLVSITEKRQILGASEIIKSLNYLNEFLFIYLKANSLSIKSNQTVHEKLKWLGNISQLATLFHDLSQGTNNLKTIFIQNSRQELKTFITENFIDVNGKSFNEATVYRILDANRTDTKKSKDRFNLPDNLSDN